MSVDRELLWQAWPKGFLAKCGVRTVGSWICAEEDPLLFVLVKDGRVLKYNGTDVFGDRQVGELLPNVTLHDMGTWGHIEQDMAEAMGWADCLGHCLQFYLRKNYCWRMHVAGESKSRVWDLLGEDGKYIQDPTVALVMARIEIRKEFGR